MIWDNGYSHGLLDAKKETNELRKCLKEIIKELQEHKSCEPDENCTIIRDITNIIEQYDYDPQR